MTASATALLVNPFAQEQTIELPEGTTVWPYDPAQRKYATAGTAKATVLRPATAYLSRTAATGEITYPPSLLLDVEGEIVEAIVTDALIAFNHQVARYSATGE